MTIFSGPPSNAIRNKLITSEPKVVLDTAAQAAGVTEIQINSGGQDALGEGTRRTGSTRHDYGRAADIQCKIGNRTLSFTNQKADPEMLAFVEAAAATGANGIGAGTDYNTGGYKASMGLKQGYFDGGKYYGEHIDEYLIKVRSVTAATAHPALSTLGRFIVIARSGLKLRSGPGTDYDWDRILALGTELDVIQADMTDPS